MVKNSQEEETRLKKVLETLELVWIEKLEGVCDRN